jgi:large subunit ribosomal protein L6
MHVTQITEHVAIPDGVTVRMDGPVIHIKGPKGELTRTVGTKLVVITVEGNDVVLVAKNATRNEKRTLQTNRSHVENMVRGASEGHIYRLKICSGHFPMSVAIKGTELEVKNFIGEAVPRRLKFQPNVSVKMNGTEITVESCNKENAGNQAAAIELLMRRPGFDPRVFQDGIYIVEKDGKKV